MSTDNILATVRHHSRRAAWAAADQGINPLLQLVLTPYFISKLGRQDFGLWVLGITLVNMSQVVSCGAAMAATKHVSADLASGASQHAVAAMRAAVTVALVGGAAAAVLLWVVAPAVAAAFFSALGRSAFVAPVLLMAGIAAGLQEIDGVYSGAMRGAERFDLSAKIEIPARIGMGFVLLHVATRYGTAHAMFIGLILTLAAKATLKAWQVSVLFADLRCCLPSISMIPLKRVFHFGVWQWLQAIGSALFTSMDQLLVGGLLGSRALMRYSVCLQLAQYVHMIPSVMMQVIFPRVSSLGPGLDGRRRNSMLRSATIVAVGLAGLVGIPLMILAHPLLAVWIGPTFADENRWLLVLLVIIHIVLAINVGAYFILLGSGESARSAKIVLSAGVAQSVVAIILAPFGLFAFACNRLVYAIGTAFLYKAAQANPNGR